MREPSSVIHDSDSESDLTPYKKKLKRIERHGGPRLVKQYKACEALRSKIRRDSMSPEQRQHYNEKARIRNKKYREKLQQEGKIKKKKTRNEKARIKEYNKIKKRESRERKSDKERKRLRLAALEESMQCPADNEAQESKSDPEASESDPEANKSDSSVERIYQVVQDLLKDVTPKKKAKLSKKGICTPKTAEKQTISSEIVDSMVEEAERLKPRRSKRALTRRRSLLHTLSGMSAEEVLTQVFYLYIVIM